jgi:hypothetical protein
MLKQIKGDIAGTDAATGACSTTMDLVNKLINQS